MSGTEPPQLEVVGPPTTWTVLRNRNVALLFVGNLVSNMGTWFQNIAAGIVVFDLTRSSLWVGAINFAQFLPALVLVALTGAAADRFDRRRLLQATQVFAFVIAAVLTGLSLAGLVTPGVLLLISALLGLSLAFMAPAILALVPLLVDRSALQPAVSINSISFNLGRAAGPVLGAAVVVGLGSTWAFGLNALSFLVFAVVLLFVRPQEQRLVRGARPRLRESIEEVRNHRILWVLLVVVGAVSLTTDPVNTLTPEMAIDQLGNRALTGWLVGAFGMGATLTAFFLLDRAMRFRHALAVALMIEGLGILVFAVSPNLPVALFGMALAGAGFIASLTRVTTRIQTEVADDQRGRVMAIWTVMFVGSRPIGSLVDGLLADTVGLRWAAAAMAVPALLAAAWVLRLNVRYRRQAVSDPHNAGGATSVAR